MILLIELIFTDFFTLKFVYYLHLRPSPDSSENPFLRFFNRKKDYLTLFIFSLEFSEHRL